MDRPPPYSSVSEPHKPPDLAPLATPDLTTRSDSKAATLGSIRAPGDTLEVLQTTSLSNGDRDTAAAPSPRLAQAPKTGGAPLPLNHLPSSSWSTSSQSARVSTPTETVSTMSIDDSSRKRDASVSMDDPNDRMAAEALCGLGKVESRSSARPPSGYETPLQYYPIDIEHARPGASKNESEPLLSLLTSSHPWLGGTINNSLSAYTSTKSHSPRFIQYGANLVERKIGSPVANTVGSVGRKTGVEDSLRRYLGARRSSELDRIDPEILRDQSASNKRRRISGENDNMEMEDNGVRRTLSGHASIDTLPVYDENRSPAYEESESDQHQRQQGSGDSNEPSTSTTTTSKRPSVSRSWSTQLMISTSGLGAALNEPSLRSLKYCLGILRGANTHVGELMEALKRLLSDYERAIRKKSSSEPSVKDLEGGSSPGDMQLDAPVAKPPVPEKNDTGDSLAKRIQHLNHEIWQTLKNVVNTVSRYTGGALPENASAIVRWQLMSVPRRWQRAVSSAPSTTAAPSTSESAGTGAPASGSTSASPAEHEVVGNARRMLAFAIEGIDMMEQVGGVVDSTISSAEKWLDSLGRKPHDGGESKDNAAGGAASGTDVQMNDSSALEPLQEQQPREDRSSEEMQVDTST